MRVRGLVANQKSQEKDDTMRLQPVRPFDRAAVRARWAVLGAVVVCSLKPFPLAGQLLPAPTKTVDFGQTIGPITASVFSPDRSAGSHLGET